MMSTCPRGMDTPDAGSAGCLWLSTAICVSSSNRGRCGASHSHSRRVYCVLSAPSLRRCQGAARCPRARGSTPRRPPGQAPVTDPGASSAPPGRRSGGSGARGLPGRGVWSWRGAASGVGSARGPGTAAGASGAGGAGAGPGRAGPSGGAGPGLGASSGGSARCPPRQVPSAAGRARERGRGRGRAVAMPRGGCGSSRDLRGWIAGRETSSERGAGPRAAAQGRHMWTLN